MARKQGRSLHWVLRAILSCVGLFLFLFGGLCTAVAVAMEAPKGNAQAAGNIGVAVQIVMVIFFALVTASGGFLMWVAVRRRSNAACQSEQALQQLQYTEYDETEVPEEALATCGAATVIGGETLFGGAGRNEYRPGSQTPATEGTHATQRPGSQTPATDARPHTRPVADWRELSGTVDSEKQNDNVLFTPTVQRPADREFGPFLASCGPERNGLTYNYVAAGIYFLLALLCVVAPGRLVEIKIDQALATKIALLPAAIGIGMAILYLWTPLFARPQTIELFERGIVEQLGDDTRRIELSAIAHLRVQEWYEHRFADQTFNVKALVRGGQPLEFSTSLRGQGEQIIDYLIEVVPQTEFVRFQC